LNLSVKNQSNRQVEEITILYIVFISISIYIAYHIIFLSFDSPNTPDGIDDSMLNPMSRPTESALAMFLMSMTNFGDYYGAFERTGHESEVKLACYLFSFNTIENEGFPKVFLYLCLFQTIYLIMLPVSGLHSISDRMINES
jgi:hypothetical protein